MSKQTTTKPFYNSTIPSDWEVMEVGEVCNKFLNGGTPSTQVEGYWNGKIPWITGADIVEQRIPVVRKFISEKAVKESSTNVIPKGNLLLVTRTGVGKLAVAPFDVAISQDLTGLFLNEKLIDTEFVFYFFDGSENRLRQLNQGTSISGITRDVLKTLKLPLPPLPEQKAIAHLLSLMDTAINKNNLLIAEKELQKKWLMQNLLTGKKRLKGFEKAKWKEHHLGSLGETYTGLTGKSKEDFGEGKPFIPYLNIFFNSSIDKTNFDFVRITSQDKQNRVKYGDILFTVSSETQNEVGMASVLLEDIEELYLNSFCFGFRLHDFKTLVPEFSSYFFRAPAFRKQVYKLSQGATRYNLSKTQLMKETIILPSVDEQKEIAQVLQAADTEIKLLKTRTEKLREKKKGLMQQLLTGKLRLKTDKAKSA